MLLLDSQALLWVLSGSTRLGPGARRLVTSSSAVHVSVATIWELTIKDMLGKVELPADLPGVLDDQGFAILDITAAHAHGLRAFPELVRHDPFDRLIIAQARVSGLRLLTADRVLLGLDQDFVVDAGR
ncbi:type II toxin-antitoxin system VapC family toxin [Pseudonocardia parietis]|uniref:PIN domain nuclease of toxin-antitoxin system n=1 Tax=Pseudonocardia parietis TaxID=570936 RepID=A0ABS4VL91_9PSEU|nr:type II toxin-antitoxin system VapC family toxin [Pseudonocardia parietis]MBP2364675.1 PIN domain nuclease of toxin-antitoxin system [Pseudonocardia parietis]